MKWAREAFIIFIKSPRHLLMVWPASDNSRTYVNAIFAKDYLWLFWVISHSYFNFCTCCFSVQALVVLWAGTQFIKNHNSTNFWKLRKVKLSLQRTCKLQCDQAPLQYRYRISIAYVLEVDFWIELCRTLEKINSKQVLKNLLMM